MHTGGLSPCVLGKFKSDVLMGIRAAVTSSLCLKRNGTCASYKFFYAYFEAVQTRLVSNCGEFAIIKIGIINTLPNAKELHRISIAKPVGYKKVTIFGFQHICNADVILAIYIRDLFSKGVNVSSKLSTNSGNRLSTTSGKKQ